MSRMSLLNALNLRKSTNDPKMLEEKNKDLDSCRDRVLGLFKEFIPLSPKLNPDMSNLVRERLQTIGETITATNCTLEAYMSAEESLTEIRTHALEALKEMQTGEQAKELLERLRNLEEMASKDTTGFSVDLEIRAKSIRTLCSVQQPADLDKAEADLSSLEYDLSVGKERSRLQESQYREERKAFCTDLYNEICKGLSALGRSNDHALAREASQINETIAATNCPTQTITNAVRELVNIKNLVNTANKLNEMDEREKGLSNRLRELKVRAEDESLILEGDLDKRVESINNLCNDPEQFDLDTAEAKLLSLKSALEEESKERDSCRVRVTNRYNEILVLVPQLNLNKDAGLMMAKRLMPIQQTINTKYCTIQAIKEAEEELTEIYNVVKAESVNAEDSKRKKDALSRLGELEVMAKNESLILEGGLDTRVKSIKNLLSDSFSYDPNKVESHLLALQADLEKEKNERDSCRVRVTNLYDEIMVRVSQVNKDDGAAVTSLLSPIYETIHDKYCPIQAIMEAEKVLTELCNEFKADSVNAEDSERASDLLGRHHAAERKAAEEGRALKKSHLDRLSELEDEINDKGMMLLNGDIHDRLQSLKEHAGTTDFEILLENTLANLAISGKPTWARDSNGESDNIPIELSLKDELDKFPNEESLQNEDVEDLEKDKNLSIRDTFDIHDLDNEYGARLEARVKESEDLKEFEDLNAKYNIKEKKAQAKNICKYCYSIPIMRKPCENMEKTEKEFEAFLDNSNWGEATELMPLVVKAYDEVIRIGSPILEVKLRYREAQIELNESGFDHAKAICKDPPRILSADVVKNFKSAYQSFLDSPPADMDVAPIKELIKAVQKLVYNPTEKGFPAFQKKMAMVRGYEAAREAASKLAKRKLPEKVKDLVMEFNRCDGEVREFVSANKWDEAIAKVDTLATMTKNLIEAYNTCQIGDVGYMKKCDSKLNDLIKKTTEARDISNMPHFITTFSADVVTQLDDIKVFLWEKNDFARFDAGAEKLSTDLDLLDKAKADYKNYLKKLKEAEKAFEKTLGMGDLPSELKVLMEKMMNPKKNSIIEFANKGEMTKANELLVKWHDEAKAWREAKGVFKNFKTGTAADHAALRKLLDKTPGGSEVLDSLIDDSRNKENGLSLDFTRSAIVARHGDQHYREPQKEENHKKDMKGVKDVGDLDIKALRDLSEEANRDRNIKSEVETPLKERQFDENNNMISKNKDKYGLSRGDRKKMIAELDVPRKFHDDAGVGRKMLALNAKIDHPDAFYIAYQEVVDFLDKVKTKTSIRDDSPEKRPLKKKNSDDSPEKLERQNQVAVLPHFPEFKDIDWDGNWGKRLKALKETIEDPTAFKEAYRKLVDNLREAVDQMRGADKNKK